MCSSDLGCEEEQSVEDQLDEPHEADCKDAVEEDKAGENLNLNFDDLINISFSQSPPCHIPSMNVRLITKKINQGFTRLNHLTLISRTRLYRNPHRITRP